MTPDEQIAELEEMLAKQRQQLDVALALNAVLQARVEELEARLAKDMSITGGNVPLVAGNWLLRVFDEADKEAGADRHCTVIC